MTNPEHAASDSDPGLAALVLTGKARRYDPQALQTAWGGHNLRMILRKLRLFCVFDLAALLNRYIAVDVTA